MTVRERLELTVVTAKNDQLLARKAKLSMRLGYVEEHFGKIRHGAVTVGPFRTVRVPS